MENKLTIEHVFQYLPYNLEFITDKGRWTLESLDKAGWICVGRKAMYCENLNLQSIKPLLIPLSELNKQWYDTIKEECPLGLTDDDYSKLWKMFTVIMSDKRHAPYFFIAILCKYHFDFQGLIDQGLALNKLNYK